MKKQNSDMGAHAGLLGFDWIKTVPVTVGLAEKEFCFGPKFRMSVCGCIEVFRIGSTKFKSNLVQKDNSSPYVLFYNKTIYQHESSSLFYPFHIHTGFCVCYPSTYEWQ